MTSKQALDHITTYAVSDHYLRAVLLDMDAIRIVEHVQADHLSWQAGRDVLLNSSRRALVSLADVEVNMLLQQLHAVQQGDSSTKDRVLNEIRGFLKFVQSSFRKYGLYH